ncbi:MAG: NUDIX hydrolase [Patescibacteria group bacterium]|jgi:ADP-ribose pyrophosphatase
MKTKLKKWKKITSHVLFRNKYFDLHEDIVRLPNGALTKYYINNPDGRAVHVLAVDDQKRMLVTKEYRHAVGKVMLGAIGGSVDRGETPLHAAQREMKEETGFRAKHWRYLGKYFANPARSGAVFYVFVASGLTSGSSHPEPAEIIETEFLPLGRLDSMMKRGLIDDGYSLASYMLFRIKTNYYGLN